MWPETLGLNVSRESLEKLTIYEGLLRKWQKAINLVSPATIEDAWVRHFADSVQVSQYVPAGAKTVMDWGSGAGFPGVVLAIVRPELEVHLVESDERKCQFMRTVSRETNASIRIHTSRIESLSLQDIQPDIITARALASLEKLLDYAVPFLSARPDLQMVLLKGAQVDEEISAARERYDFSLSQHASVTDLQARVLCLSSIKVL